MRTLADGLGVVGQPMGHHARAHRGVQKSSSTPPVQEIWCGRTLAEDVDWTTTALKEAGF